MKTAIDRRKFFGFSSGMLAAGSVLAALPRPGRAAEHKFKISLAEWSLHRAIHSGLVSNLEFPRVAREQFGIGGLEFVNQLWAAPTQRYVAELKNNMQQTGTEGVLIMCDGEGRMGHSGKAARMRAAANHHKWVDIAAELGCHAIRTNMHPDDEPSTPQQIEDFLGRCSESFAALCEYAQKSGINVLIENHGGLSSDPDVVVRLMKKVEAKNFGTLPDFGNFPQETDNYEAVAKLMPYAKAVSMKCYDFNEEGEETRLDLTRLLDTAAEAGYKSWAGIEFEGRRLTEFEGIQAAKRFIERYNAA